MSECIILSEIKTCRDEFGITECGGFKRMDLLFKHALIRVRAGRTIVKSIYVKCPKCGRVGRLVSRRRYKCGLRLYTVVHKSDRTANGIVSCRIPVTHPANEYVDVIYRKYRIKREWW